MKLSDVYTALSGAGIPIAYMAWPKGSAPQLPWAVYYLDDYDGVRADDEMWCEASKYIVELYQRLADEDVRERVEQAITASFGGFDKEETWVEDEGVYMTTYRFTAIDRSNNG